MTTLPGVSQTLCAHPKNALLGLAGFYSPLFLGATKHSPARGTHTTFWTRSPGWRPGSLRFKPMCAHVRLSAPPLSPQRAAYSLLPAFAPVTPPSPPTLNGPPGLCAAMPGLLPSLMLLWGTVHALSHRTPSTLECPRMQLQLRSHCPPSLGHTHHAQTV